MIKIIVCFYLANYEIKFFNTFSPGNTENCNKVFKIFFNFKIFNICNSTPHMLN